MFYGLAVQKRNGIISSAKEHNGVILASIVNEKGNFIMKIIFIRHGDPDYEKDSLTEKGFREAELLRRRVETWNVRDFYCSPLGRAQKTAKPFLESMNRKATICTWLKEFFVPVKDADTGKDRIPWDFMPGYFTKEELLYDKDKWFDAPIMQTGDVKMEYIKVCKEFDKLLKKYGYVRDGRLYRVEKHNDDTIVFICHLGVSFVLVSHLLGIPAPLLWQGFFMPPTSLIILDSEERTPKETFFRCQTFGDTRHLSEGGEPISGSGYFADIFQN